MKRQVRGCSVSLLTELKVEGLKSGAFNIHADENEAGCQKVGVGDPITLMDSDSLITFMKVIVTFYPLLWIRLLVSFIAICTQLD